jgi:general secretion pathway protein D
MKSSIHARSVAALLVTICLLLAPVAAFAKGDKNYKRGLEYEAAQQWEKAAQEFALAVAANPSRMEYQLHYRRALFNASQMFMIRGRALAEQLDYAGAYNAFRQAYAYDPVNELALSEMERMLRLQHEQNGESPNGTNGQPTNGNNGATVSPTVFQPSSTGVGNAAGGNAQRDSSATDGIPRSSGTGGTPAETTQRSPGVQDQPPPRAEQLRVISYSGDLKSFIRSLAEQLNINIVFDRQSFQQPRTIDINLRDVTTAQALDFIFLQEGLFFQRLNRRTILVADQTRRMQYQQLVIRTFYLANVDPADAQKLIGAAIPPQAGRQTIVIPDKSTNSLTVRDTPENIRLIGDLLQSIDKDRAEVVMDVNIYEVSRNDLLQFGNQIGDAANIFSIGGGSPLVITSGSRNVVTEQITRLPTTFGGALIIPASTLTAFQRKNNTRLLASTQIHAFNGEESSARIGQRVPVQTAQTYPFGTTNTGSTTGVNSGVGFAGGFPVFNYEPTGLTLKFTPQVFPNLDVQVKMSIESKDVLNPGSVTPTFTERTITGTARIQNNRTMMLASVAQDSQSSGRQGLPLLSALPILGRLFSAPTRTNTQVDIVMAVTPRVLRAPTVTPEDERMRPSGTLQTPTTGSLEAMIQEADREDQLAAARLNQYRAAQLATAATAPAQTNPVVQNSAAPQTNNAAAAQNSAAQTSNIIVPLSDIDAPPSYVPAPASLMNSAVTSSQTGAAATKSVPANMQTSVQPKPASDTRGAAPKAQNHAEAQTSNPVTNKQYNPPPRAIDVVATMRALNTQPTVALDTTPSRSTAAANAAATTIAPPATTTGTSVPALVEKRTTETGARRPAPTSAAELRLVPEQQEMRVSERRRLALVLKTDAPLGLAVLTLRFDPRNVVVRGVSVGNLFAGAQNAPTLTQTINPGGLLLISVAPPGGASMTGAGVLIFIDIEAVAVGESAIEFDKENIHLMATDGRGVLVQFVQSSVRVKQ